MARTAITTQSIGGGATSGVRYRDFTWTAGDPSNGNEFASTGKEEVLVRNINASSPPQTHKATLRGLSSTYIERTMAAGEYGSFGQVPTTGWRITPDNKIYLDVDSAEIEVAVLVHP